MLFGQPIHFLKNGEPKRRRIHIIGRLRSVHVVIGVDVPIVPVFKAQRFQRKIGNHFIRIHVCRGACAALDHVHDEMLVMVTCQQFVTGVLDRCRFLGG